MSSILVLPDSIILLCYVHVAYYSLITYSPRMAYEHVALSIVLTNKTVVLDWTLLLLEIIFEICRINSNKGIIEK